MRIASASLAALLLLSPVAIAQEKEPQAQTACMPSAHAMVDFLAENYGEIAVMGGLATDTGNFVAVFTNPMTGTWSFTEVLSNGEMCLIASGEQFIMHIPQTPETPGVDA